MPDCLIGGTGKKIVENQQYRDEIDGIEYEIQFRFPQRGGQLIIQHGQQLRQQQELKGKVTKPAYSLLRVGTGAGRN